MLVLFVLVEIFGCMGGLIASNILVLLMGVLSLILVNPSVHYILAVFIIVISGSFLVSNTAMDINALFPLAMLRDPVGFTVAIIPKKLSFLLLQGLMKNFTLIIQILVNSSLINVLLLLNAKVLNILTLFVNIILLFI
jgi:hypothetical protein